MMTQTIIIIIWESVSTGVNNEIATNTKKLEAIIFALKGFVEKHRQETLTTSVDWMSSKRLQQLRLYRVG